MNYANPGNSDHSSPGRCEVCVLAPWPIFTVTIEGGATGEDEIYLHAGGQGFWVARMIANLGGTPILCGPFGGESGIIVKAMAQAEGVELRSIAAHGWNGGYVHDRRGGEREVIAETPSPALNRHEADNLYDVALTTGLRAGVAVLTGVPRPGILPPTFFQRLALDLAANDVSVVADLAGEPLKALTGGVTFLKINDDEMVAGGFARSTQRGDVISGLWALQATGARNLLVSRGAEPALALLDSRVVEVHPPRFQPLDYRGAGDSMTAALAVAQARGLDPMETLRLGAAAGAINVTRHGLGTGDLADIMEIASRITIREVDDASEG